MRISISVLALTLLAMTQLSHAKAARTFGTPAASPADVAVEDLNWPHQPNYVLTASSIKGFAELSQAQAQTAALISKQKFEGYNCGLKTNTQQALIVAPVGQQPARKLFPVPYLKGQVVTLLAATDGQRADLRFSLTSGDHNEYNATTYVQLDKNLERVVSFKIAACEGTRTLGLQYACYVTSNCRAVEAGAAE